MSVADRSALRTVWKIGRLAGNEDAVVTDVLHQPFDQFDGRRVQARKSDGQFLVLTCGGGPGDCWSLD